MLRKLRVTNRTLVIKGVALLALLFGGAGQTNAGPIKVLFLGYDIYVVNTYADIMGSTDSRFDYANSGYIEDWGSFLPSLPMLQQYDAVLVWTNFSPPSGLGNLLADYVDAGGGVVLSTFNGLFSYYGWISGRINTPGYNPFTGPTHDANQSVSLGAFDGSSPLFTGVSSLSSHRYNGDWTGVDPGATLAGSWDNGRPLAGLSANGRVANISLFPNVASYHHASGDYQQLFRNALAVTASPSVAAVPEPSSLALLGMAGASYAGYYARRRRQSAAD